MAPCAKVGAITGHSPPVEGWQGRLADGSTMARAYKVSSDHPSVDYLVRSRADLGGRIKSNLKEAKDLADAIRRG